MMMENLKNPYDSIRADDLHRQLDGHDSPLLVDVRPQDMFAKSFIARSINIPMDDFASRASELPDDRNAPMVLVCGVGKFSKNWTLYLKSMGYRNVKSLKGGIGEWVRKGHPTESQSPADS